MIHFLTIGTVLGLSAGFSPGPLFPVSTTISFGGFGELPAFAALGVAAGIGFLLGVVLSR